MTTREASSSSFSKSKLWSYDVFLSFSGKDTRNGFISHLHEALKDRGYRVFIDEDGLKRGEEIKEKLFDAIEESRISIIVFSKMYADSSWCLDELVKIMECRDKQGRHVLPIFYHVDPSHVRKQDGDLAKAFQKYEKDIREEKDDKKREAKQERVKQWREALTEAANLSGHHLQSANNKKRRREAHTESTNLSDHQTTGNGREAEFIKKIVDENIWEWLPRTNELHVAKHPIGIKSRIQGIINDLSSGGSNDVLMVGIWGMGGLGKTTVAKAIYNEIHRMFEFKSFLADVSDTSSKHGLVYLQETLISDILKQKSQIRSVDIGISMIQQVVQHRRVLIIIDNIDDRKQLDAIARSHDWFGPGSRIIMTTRNEHLLIQVEVDKIYPLWEMKNEEAVELFSWHAFGKSCPNEEYLDVSEKVVSYCGGLPLALEVLGSFLFKRPIKEWKSQLEKLERIPEGKIIKSLRISFEGLDDTQKAIFLDISCFFIGCYKDHVAKVLDGCGFYATVGISVLRERCLVTFENNELHVHDLLREMARVIISEKSPYHPGKWSRLWNRQEVIDVLTNKSGTGKIEGLALEFPDPWLPISEDTEIASLDTEIAASFSTEAFANMKNLRLLHLDRVELKGEYKHLPKELIWLRWEGCPLKSIPNDFFNQPRLVGLEMECSSLVQVWEGSKSLHNLKTLDLTRSLSLQKSPDFSQVPNLEELILVWCYSLSEIHPSIGHLKRLSLVNLTGCNNLISLPRDFYKLKSVEALLLNGCSEFIELHEDIGEMISLRTLEAKHTAIREVPPSIVGLKNLTYLSLMGTVRGIQLSHSLRELDLTCGALDDAIKDLGSLIYLQHLHLQGNKFHSLPNLSGLSRLETLSLNGSRYLRTIPDLPTNLKVLLANHCPALETMPDFSEMSNMRELDVGNSAKLTEVPGLDKSLNSMAWIDMHGCPNITADFRKNILQGWTSFGFGGIAFHGNYVPDWFDFVNEGTKVSFDIPLTDDRKFEGLTLFCWFRVCKKKYLPLLDIIVTSNTNRTKLQAYKTIEEGTIDENFEDDYLWQGQLSNNELNLQGEDKVEILFENNSGWVEMMRTGVNLVWDSDEKGPSHVTSDNELNLQGRDKVDIDFEDPLANWDYPAKIMSRGDYPANLDDARIFFDWDPDEEGPSHDSYDFFNLQGGDKVNILFEDHIPITEWDHSVKMMRTGVNLVWDKPMKENMHDLDDTRTIFDWDPAEFYDEEGPSHDASYKLICAE